MFEWLTTVQSAPLNPAISILGMRLLLAWLCGWLVALIARRHQPAVPDTLTLTLVLMCVLIAMATQIIGDNVARAFSLVGALSIVRFRTAVPATRDVAFVLAAVVVGMAIGAGQYWVTLLGLAVVALATRLVSPSRAGQEAGESFVDEGHAWRITLQVGLGGTGGWEAELQRLTESAKLLSAETIRRGGAMELIYQVTPRPGTNAMDLIAALHMLPAVESVASKVVDS